MNAPDQKASPLPPQTESPRTVTAYYYSPRTRKGRWAGLLSCTVPVFGRRVYNVWRIGWRLLMNAGRKRLWPQSRLGHRPAVPRRSTVDADNYTYIRRLTIRGDWSMVTFSSWSPQNLRTRRTDTIFWNYTRLSCCFLSRGSEPFITARHFRGKIANRATIQPLLG